MEHLESGTVVWAKLGHYPYWPGRIINKDELEENIRNQLPSKKPANTELIWFFGSDNCNYISKSNIELWEDGYAERSTDKKAKSQKGFVKACKEAEQLVEERKQMKASPKKGKPTKSSKAEDETDKRKGKGKRKKEEEEDNEEEEEEEAEVATKMESEYKTDNKKTKHSVDEDKTSSSVPVAHQSDASALKRKLSPTAVSSSLKVIQKHPVVKYFKYEITKTNEGSATAKAVLPELRNTKEEVHSFISAIHFLIDITAYAACASVLHEGESGFTQDLHVNVLSPNIPLGSEMILTATVSQSKSPGLIFISGSVSVDSKQVAVASIIKSTTEHNYPIKK